MKDKLIFASEILLVVALVAVIQKKAMNIPVVGEFLPGYTQR